MLFIHSYGLYDTPSIGASAASRHIKGSITYSALCFFTSFFTTPAGHVNVSILAFALCVVGRRGPFTFQNVYLNGNDDYFHRISCYREILCESKIGAPIGSSNAHLICTHM